jgi:hypothetical protein
LIWSGSEYVLAWIDVVDAEFRVRAMRLNASARPLDETPIEVGTAASSRMPALTLVPEGVKIAYERLDSENHDAVRIFARTLERQPSTRTRAVR